MLRVANVVRTTKETDIDLAIRLEGTGKAEIETGNGFFDHMLTLFCAHARLI